MAQSKSQDEQSTTKKEKAIYKVFNDSVHGHIEMHPLLVKIIDTPEFQRLRNIKQLGGGYYVYPGASHNRFEHSLGVAHLAGKLLQSLKKNLPEGIEITPNDELCVQIAALCHDLGHGPFSHAFDIFMKDFDSSWKHEDVSVKMFNHLIEENGIKEIMGKENENWDAFSEKDFTFITELIQGPSNSASEWPYKGREKKKAFLYDIVANHRNGIDVDKMDYFTRDCHHLGMKCNFSHERFITFARVCEENGETQICMRDKEAMNMYELFHVRNLLHHNAYQHRVIKAVELMIMDALKEANDHFKFEEAAMDPKRFVDLTDDILQKILDTPEKSTKVEKAQKIIKRVLERDLYKFLGAKTFQPQELKHLTSDEEWKKVLKTWLGKIQTPEVGSQRLKLEYFKEVPIKFNYGMKDKNPIDSLRFYRKCDPNTPIKLSKDEVSYLLPEKFAETKVMLFYKGEEDKEKKDVEELAKREIKHFWNDLDIFSSAIKNSRTYMDFTDFSKLLEKKMVTAQEICEVFSNQGFYRFIAEETFKPKKLELVDNSELQKALEAWLEELEQQAGRQKIVQSAKDFELVPYTPPESDSSNLYLKYKGLFREDLDKFWQIVCFGPASDYSFREFLCLYLVIAKEVTVRLLRQGYFLIDEKALETKLTRLDDGKWTTVLENWLKDIQKQAQHQQFRFTANNFKVVSYHLPCQTEISKVMLFYKGLTEDDVEKLWEQVRKV
ncbi:deoxynucleoside triphosphate triphosphohydrolase SAMHD1-like [Astyanax mexicanus]|uniref:Deoxynucleoside triphosphate triphosphohydrolase SAMHD1-like n=1 Tax=Astyanax mexicanus TaxID=7994 RepID=A0A8T2KU80_ASTMX|nr:deoxynucleoside triphosphate triphosphohydrolase SAMHD1-like [Astyanax mexicanus]